MGSESDLRTVQLAELSLLKLLIEICEQNSIRYFAMGGTLLGAVRHNGFIPWDDDADIGVPRPDYERLCMLLQNRKFPGNISFHTWKNDKSYIRYFARLEDRSRVLIRRDRRKPEKSAAWVDIFPLDGMPDNFFARKLKEAGLLCLRAAYKLSAFDELVVVDKPGRPFYERVLIFTGMHTAVSRLFNTRKCLEGIDRALCSSSYEDCGYLVNAMGAYKFKEMFPKDVYGDGKMYRFEDIMICGPYDCDTVCRRLYGDYMKFPEQKERNHHKSYFPAN